MVCPVGHLNYPRIVHMGNCSGSSGQLTNGASLANEYSYSIYDYNS